MARKLTATVKLQLRLSEALRRRLEREAAHKKHSMNTEILGRLEQSFDVPDQTTAIINAVTAAVEPALLEKLVKIIREEKDIFDYGAKTIEEGSK